MSPFTTIWRDGLGRVAFFRVGETVWVDAHKGIVLDGWEEMLKKVEKE